MKKILLTIATMLVCFGLSAQNVDGGATATMKKLASKYAAFSTIKIDYTYKCEKNGKVIDSKTGKMFVKGSKYYFTFGDQISYCDGKNLWNYQKSVNEVSIYEYDEAEDNLLNPAAILSGWDKEYRAKFIRDEFENGKSLQIIDMTPIHSSSYYKIRLFIDKSTNEIVKISAYEKDNTIYCYSIDKMVVNSSIEDGVFTFDKAKYPSVDVNDMR